MQCLKCGANLKDKTVVCNKCGFIVKGSRKREASEMPISFEERVNNASAEELRSMLLAYATGATATATKEEESPEVVTVRKGKRWAILSLIAGIVSLCCSFIPGINIILAAVFFVLAFYAFGASNGQKPNLALIGVILSIVAVVWGWVYNKNVVPVWFPTETKETSVGTGADGTIDDGTGDLTGGDLTGGDLTGGDLTGGNTTDVTLDSGFSLT